MARVTVEDCIDIVPNHFELVVLSTQLAREINVGLHRELVETIETQRQKTNSSKEKPCVQSLRQIAAKTVDVTRVKDAVLSNMLNAPAQLENQENQTDPAHQDSGAARQSIVTATDQPTGAATNLSSDTRSDKLGSLFEDEVNFD